LWLPACQQPPLRYELSRAGAAIIFQQAREVDRLYAEPRSPERLEKSLELSLAAISPHDGYSMLWRAGRACAWLAERHPDLESRRRYARLGAAAGAEALRLSAASPQAHYFYALNLGLLSELEGGSLGNLDAMVVSVRRVIELDERYDHAGGHRFMALLIDATKDNFVAAIGTLDDALEHIDRACRLDPDYGHNHLIRAKLLIQDEEFEAAREALARVLSSPPPAHESEEHQDWLAEAGKLLAALPAPQGR
jgi:tetratricopeptide (TPR) repeat protein